MDWLTVLILFIIYIIISIISLKKNSSPPIEIQKDDDVSFEDMMIHDMVNTDETWDIGKVDFND